MKTLKSLYKKTPILNLFILILTIASMIGCSKDDGPAPKEIIKNTEKQITSFVFLLINNPITSTPAAVCVLQTSNWGILTLLTDAGEGCN